MTASYDYDGNPLTRVRRGSVELTQCAEHMTVGTGRLVYDDTPGTLDIVGQMDFAADEDACANPITARGFIGPRGYSRQSERKSLAREIDIELQDLNAMAGFRRLRAKAGMTAAQAGNRPAETVAQRGAWLMASPFVAGLFTDEGRCDFPADKGMDKADYRNQFPGDVISDMFLASLGYNAYIREFGDGPELVFRDDNASTADTIDLRVSNVISDVTGDVSGLTFYPMKDAVLRRDPSEVVSELGYQHAQGTVDEERSATADDFNGERGAVASNANIKTAAKAHDEAKSVLWQRHTEEDTIECTIQVPASAVNLVNHGDRMQARFSHLTPEGYGSMTWFRVLEATKVPLLRPVAKYNIRLKLSPQEAAETFPDLTPLQSAFGRNGSAFGGLMLTLPNPVTVGHKLLVLVSQRDQASPPAPNTGANQARFGAGGWTRLDGSDINAITITTGTQFDGFAGYYKTADSTDQSGFVGGAYSIAGIWELPADADLASGTVVTKNAQTTTADPEVFNVGSLGTPDAGDFCAMIVGWSPSTNDSGYGGEHEYLPLPAVSPGDWTNRYYKGSYSFGAGHNAAEAHPLTWIGDTMGEGAALSASVSKARGYTVPNPPPSFNTGTVGWAGVAIRVPPL